MLREFEDWVEAFYEFTSFAASPSLFRRWAAISCIAGALERKVWVVTQGAPVYPNLYTVFVAPPGIGKSKLTSRVDRLWRALPDHHVAPTSITKAALADGLADAQRTIQRPRETPSVVNFNSLKILSNELGTLIPSYDTEFMAALTDIYDGSLYAEKRRSQKEGISIPAPQINLLAATTPSHLNDFLPAGAWDQGFLSRTLLIYSGERIIGELFGGPKEEAETYKRLQNDLKQIGNLYGEIKFSRSAAEAITQWHLKGGPPVPDHPKLHHYTTRRTLHLLKLCMVASVSENNSLTISLDNYRTALNWLTEAEDAMPDIFKAMTTGGDSKAIEETWYYVYKMNMKTKKPVPEGRVYQFLGERVPTHNIERIVQVMSKAGLLKEVQVNKIGMCYQAEEKRTLH